MAKKKVIIDCDPGTDDAQAILIALASENIEIVAITTVFGNSLIENTTRNAVRLLKYVNQLHVPVYKGCASSLLAEHSTSNQPYHGKDGFGDVDLENIDPVDMSCIKREHAAAALCRLVNEQPGSITLVAIGPLTNIAVALMLDPQVGTKLQDCIIMGGNYMGKGNVTACAEFNWYSDPEAAFRVLESLNRMITVIPLETCSDTSFSWEWYNNATSKPTRSAKLIKTIDSVSVDLLRSRNTTNYLAWDQLAMAIVVDPAIVVEAKEQYATVELHGHVTRGQMVVDWNHKLKKTPNVRILTRIDQKRYENVALTAFSV